MQITLASFFRPTKSKLFIFYALVVYCLGAIMLVKAPFNNGIYHVLSLVFAPAFYLMLAVAEFFRVGPYEFEGKGPATTPGEMAIGFTLALAFGLLVLYCIACALGVWYDSVHRRVHTNAGKK